MQKAPEQIIKELFPQVPHKDRKITVKRLLLASKSTGRDFEELAKEYKQDHDKRREEALPLLLRHCLLTAMLVESNDDLKGTYFEGYYNKVAGNHGKAFMNSQTKLYLNEFEQLVTNQTANVNDLIRFKEVAAEALCMSFDQDFEKLSEVIQVWAKHPDDRKRIHNISKKILKNE